MADNEPYLVACEAQESATAANKPLPSGRRLPFKYYTIRVDPETGELTGLPPGMYTDINGKITNPHLYDATMGDAIRTLPMQGTGLATSMGNLSMYEHEMYPEHTIGASISGGPQAHPDEWKWGRVAITAGAGGATNDTQLCAGVANRKIQLSILGVAYVAKADSATNNAAVITIQDSDNVQLGGAAVITLGCSYCNVAGAAMGNDLPHREWDLMRGPVCYSATNALAIEADLAGCIQNDIVEVIYAWREFA